MSGKKGRTDARLNAARYEVNRLAPGDEAGQPDENTTAQTDGDTAGQPGMLERDQYVDVLIQQAIRRGEFDDLPGTGKPLTNLHQTYDPNWWIRQKIEREKITGLGPPALTLRTENSELDNQLDKAGSESAVRGILEDFNRRVLEARRQLQGGPPVVTPTREVEAEVEQWRERRAVRHRHAERERERERAVYAAMTRRERRRARRERGE